MSANLIWFEELKREDVALVGGKNSSLGEMISTLGPKGTGCRRALTTKTSVLLIAKLSPRNESGRAYKYRPIKRHEEAGG